MHTTELAARAGQKDDRIPVRPHRITTPKVVGNVVLVGLGVAFAVPLLWLVLASVDSHAGPTVQWPHFTLSNFSTAITTSGDMHAILDSAYIAVIATVVSTVPAVLAAYAFSRRHIPWKGPLLLLVLMLSGVPVSLMIVPVYQVFAKENWLSLVPAAIFLGVTSLPFELWIIKNFIDAVPPDLEEAARLERASTIQILLRVTLPLSLPGIAAATIYGFISAWGSFLIPLLLISAPSQQPSPVAVYTFLTSTAIHYGDIAAYSLLYSVPAVLLYLLMSRFLRGGFLLSGAIRG